MRFDRNMGDNLRNACIVRRKDPGTFDSRCALVAENSKDIDGSITAEAQMFGPFRVISSSGEELTPKGQLRPAILAVLVMAPGQSLTKQHLIDLFWSRSPLAKSRGSLRTAISELKKELAPLGAQVLLGDRYHVRLAPGALRVNMGQGAELPFLQDLDVEARGAEGFESWLRDQRLKHAPDDGPEHGPERGPEHRQEPGKTDPEPGADHATLLETDLVPDLDTGAGEGDRDAAVRLAGTLVVARDLALGLLPCRMPVPQPMLEVRANLVVDRMLDVLSAALSLKLFDYRDAYGGPGTEPAEPRHGNGPRFMLQPTLDANGETLRLRLIDARSKQVVWTGTMDGALSPGTEAEDAGQELDVARCVEQLIAAVGQGLGGEEALLSPYQALISMFHLKASDLDNIDLLLQRSMRESDQAYLHGLRCYLATVRVGENFGSSDGMAGEALYGTARRAMAPDPFHAYNLAMAGYAVSFLLGQKELGLDLARNAVDVAPSQAFCWDQYALCLFALGQFDAAFDAAQRAQALGAHSPIRYTYDTTAAIVAFARGDYLATIRFGNRAVFRMPRFTAALKYTAAALGHVQQLGDSRRLVRQIRMLGRAQPLSQITHDVGLPEADGFRDRLVTGLRRAGMR